MQSIRFFLVLLFGSLVAHATPPAAPEACGPEATLKAVQRSSEIVSWQLLGHALKSGGNPAFAGLSLAEALALAKVGATGEVAAEIQRLLGIPPQVECGPAALAGAWHATLDELAKADKSVRWNLVTGAWLAKGLNPKKLWLAVAKGEFGAQVAEVDFTKQAVHTLVNAWVKKGTAGKIDTLLSQPLDRNTVFVLANALFLDAPWSQAFSAARTKPAPFHGTQGDKDVPMMELAASFAHASNQDGELVRLPYGKDRAYEMAVWLPPAGKKPADLATEAGRQALAALLDEADVPTKGTVRLPRFKVDAFSPDLSEALQALGAKKTFAFTRDWSLLAPDKEVRVSRVAHRVQVDVSERGTTVAAATAIVGTKRAMMLEEPFQFTADRPFIYVIRHRPSNVWVAVGAYQDP